MLALYALVLEDNMTEKWVLGNMLLGQWIECNLPGDYIANEFLDIFLDLYRVGILISPVDCLGNLVEYIQIGILGKALLP